MSNCELGFYAYRQAHFKQLYEESERAFAEYVAKLGYVKPIRCKDCCSYISTSEVDEIVTPSFCSLTMQEVPGTHYCSYAWIDEED